VNSAARTALAAAATVIACSATAVPAQAAKQDVYRGNTDDGRKVKFVADADGAVIRGAVTTMTNCGQRFDPFRARFDLDRPLDRSRRASFADEGSIVEQDDRFSARYRYDIEGERKGPHALSGSFDLEVVFRKDGDEYATCTAEEVGFEARNDDREAEAQR